MVESSESTERGRSNRQGDKNVTRKIPTPRERISFRDFATLAFPSKTSAELANLTGRDERSAKRWLAGKGGGRPAIADRLLVAEIMRRLE